MSLRHRLESSGFLRAVLTLATGTAVAQAIPVAVSPVLTRLYSPSDWGTFTLFMTIAAMLGSIAAGRYELAIMLPDSEQDATALAVLGMVISAALSVALLIPAIFFGAPLAVLLGEPRLAAWLPLVAPTVLFLGIFNCLNYLTTRRAGFREVAAASVTKAGVGAAVQVAMGLFVPGPGGLMSGYVASTAAANLSLARQQSKKGHSHRGALSRLGRLAKQYADFPKYSVGSALAQTANLALIAVLLAHLYSVSSLGEYSLVQRVLGLPLLLISGSVGQVYFQRASREKRSRGDFLSTFTQTLRSLAAAALAMTIALYFVLPPVFTLAFGSQWSGSGELARYLLPGFAVQFVVSPLSLSNQINLRNRFGLLGNLVALVAMVAAVITAHAAGAGARHALLAMSITQAVYYLGFLYLIHRHVAADRQEVAK